MKKKVIAIAGFGDTGVLTAIHLARYSQYQVIGITPKPCLVSGQELGARITDPELWKQHYLLDFSQFKKLRDVDVRQGLVTHVDAENNVLKYQDLEQQTQEVAYDMLVIASGVSNGFWRHNRVEAIEAIQHNIATEHQQLSQAPVITVIGGGATGVSAAYNLARQHPEKRVDLYFSGEQVLPGYHQQVRDTLTQSLVSAGVVMHSGHRAVLNEHVDRRHIDKGTVEWQGGQPSTHADCILWAVGQLAPHSDYLPDAMLTEQGFVSVDEYLRVPGHRNVFAVGDIAASDVYRSSARNWGFVLLAKNIHALLSGREHEMKPYQPKAFRWGSVVGVQDVGLDVYQPDGGRFRFPRWSINTLLFPLFVRKMIYKGMTVKAKTDKPHS